MTRQEFARRLNEWLYAYLFRGPQAPIKSPMRRGFMSRRQAS